MARSSLLPCCVCSLAQDAPPSPADLAAIVARGRALGEYDAAVWHASDAVLALKLPPGSLGRYIGRKTSDGWVVAWGNFNSSGTKFLISCEAKQSGDVTYTVTRHDPPLEDSDWFLRAARAHAIATLDFVNAVKPQRTYNYSVLPAPDNQWYVYALPAQSDSYVLPYGGDARYVMSADGMKILDRRLMHDTIQEERLPNRTAIDLHTHTQSDRPEDSDVFYAMTAKSSNGGWIITPKYLYETTPLGELNYLGKSEDAGRLLQSDKWRKIPAAYKVMAVELARRLRSQDQHKPPVEAFIGSAGVQCENRGPWFKITAVLRNNTDRSIVVHKAALQTAQIRIAVTRSDLQNDKFDKYVVMAVTEGDALDEKFFLVLGPGMVYEWEREMPADSVNLTEKTALQVLIFTWPLDRTSAIDEQRKKWASKGSLFTESIVSDVATLAAATEGCGKNSGEQR